MVREIVVVFLLLFFFCISPVHAGKTHALAMHGQPKYAADFQHLDYANPAAPKGGELKLSKNGAFDSLNHHIITGSAAEGLEMVNDKLMQRVWDEPFTLYGLVAEYIDIAPDRSWIVFHLRKEAKFHDGQPMTAADVKFSYEMYKTYGHPVRRRVYGLVKEVNVIDERTIKFTFGEGYDAESALILAMMPVLPEHYWETKDISKTTLEIPLGSGAYKISAVDPGRKISYERVKDYWAKDLPVMQGHYNFDTITYQYFRDDDIALEAFKAGDYTLRREFDITKWMTGYDFKALTEGRVLKEEIAHGRPEWLRAMIFNTRRSLFQDRRVRQALGEMLNFEWLNKNLYHDAFKRISSYYPNSELAATKTPEGEELTLLQKYKNDVPSEVFGEAWQAPVTKDIRESQRRTTQLLKDAGWTYKDQKLVNDKGDIFSFEILLGDPNEEKIALEFSRALKKIGIEVKIRTVDSAQFTGRLESFDYDMVMYRWINTLSPGNEQMNYWSAAAARNNGSRNYAGIDNPAVDALADSIARAPDRASLVSRVRALDRVLTWGTYVIPLYYLGRDLVAYDKNIHRPDAVPTYGIVLETWWYQKQE